MQSMLETLISVLPKKVSVELMSEYCVQRWAPGMIFQSTTMELHWFIDFVMKQLGFPFEKIEFSEKVFIYLLFDFF